MISVNQRNPHQLAQEVVTSTIQADSVFVKLMKFFGVYGFTNGGTSTQPAIAYIQYIINMALWLAAFIALIILLYGFYLMFFAKQEEAFDKAKKIVIGVAVALFLMGLSWIVIQFLFYLGTLIQ